MKVILKEQVSGLGSIGSVVDVKDGYGRNFLIPNNMAVVASKSNQRELDHHKRILEKKRALVLAEKQALAKKIEALSPTLEKQVGEDQRIFGSVTTAEIASWLDENGVQVSKRDIALPDEIKKLGTYTAELTLHADVLAKLKIRVVEKPQ